MTLKTSVPVLRVSDYPRARAFWRDVLGFAIVEEAGAPVTGFGIYRRDAAQVFLIAWDGPEAPYDRWRAYFHTDDLDGIVTALREAGTAHSGPTLTGYGMREVEVSDPDGNCVCFGEDADTARTA
jgi:catechol 2,3-dioxygenase-like lactoylglutathione lyase family enzyme